MLALMVNNHLKKLPFHGVYRFMTFEMYRFMESLQQLGYRTIPSSPKIHFHYYFRVTPHIQPLPLIISLHSSFVSPRISYEWNPTVCNLLIPASVTQIMPLKLIQVLSRINRLSSLIAE